MHPDSVRGVRYAKQQKMKSPKGKKDLPVGETAAIAARAVAHGLAVSLPAGTASLSRISSISNKTRMRQAFT